MARWFITNSAQEEKVGHNLKKRTKKKKKTTSEAKHGLKG